MSAGLYSGVSGLALGTGLYRNVSGLWGGSSGLIDAFGGGGGPFPGASLYLDFLTPPLDSRITFSRGTNATLVDSTGKITYAPANLVLQSQAIASTPPWGGDTSGGSIPTATANAGTAPDGTNTAARLQINRGAGTFSRWQQTGIVGPVGFYIASVWMRTTSGTGTANVGLRNDATGVNCVVTGTWQRFSVINATAINSPNLQILSFTSIPGTDVSADILVWGAQVEPITYQTTPGTYNATTASAYYGPRFDYDPVTLAPRGLLIEEARTNFMTYSQQVGGTNWVSSGATSTLNNILAPDGTTTATLVTENTAASAHAVFGTSMTLTVATHTASVYIKTGTRRYVSVRGETASSSLYAWVTLDTQTGAINSNAAVTSASATSVGNGWYRLVLTWANTQGGPAAANIVIAGSDVATAPTTASTLGNSYTGTSSTFYVWGAQVELGAFATSYIPTVASTVSRSADVATMTGTNFSTWYNQAEGTFVVGYDQLSGDSRDIFIAASATGFFNPGSVGIFAAGTSLSGYVRASSAYTAQSNVLASLGNNTPILAAVAYKVNDVAATTQGITPVVATPPNAMPTTVVELKIMGAGVTGGGKSGHIRAIAYYNTRLPNTQLQTLTAPSLASPLALDFLSTSYTVGY